MKTLLAALFFFVILTGKSQAQNLTGMVILPMCKEATAGFNGGRCAGFIDGVISGVFLAGMNETPEQAHMRQGYCLPEAVTNGQNRTVFVKYLEDHPEELHKPAAVLLIDSLRKAFPCEK
jgi:hypothetical protein